MAHLMVRPLRTPFLTRTIRYGLLATLVGLGMWASWNAHTLTSATLGGVGLGSISTWVFLLTPELRE